MRPKSILLVDDDQFLVEVLTEKLKKSGFATTGVSNGAQALEYIEKNTPDLVLLDLIMPGMNGMETLQKLKGDEKTKKIPVIILTNLADSEVISQIKESGGSGYLIKDTQNIEEIIESIKNLI